MTGRTNSESLRRRRINVPNEVKKESDDENEDEKTYNPKPRSLSFFQRFWRNLSWSKYVIIPLLIPPILNFGALKREESALFTTGEKVSMGWGQKMYIHCKGEGFPTVILDAPTGWNSDIWVFIHSHLSKVTKVCIYDRSGLGYSDPIFGEITSDDLNPGNRDFVAQPSTLNQMVGDLHYLLKAKKLEGPLVIAGADVGALIARMYSLTYPSDVSDIILIDPLVENLFVENNEWRDYWLTKVIPYYESLHLSSFVGLSRIAVLLGFLQPPLFSDSTPSEILARQKYLLCNPRHINSALTEHMYMNASFSQIRDAWASKLFPASISVSVLSRRNPSELPPHLKEAWDKSQHFLVTSLHPHCKHHQIETSDLVELYTKPVEIVSAIKAIVYSRQSSVYVKPTSLNQ